MQNVFFIKTKENKINIYVCMYVCLLINIPKHKMSISCIKFLKQKRVLFHRKLWQVFFGLSRQQQPQSFECSTDDVGSQASNPNKTLDFFFLEFDV